MKIRHWDEASQSWVIDGASNASNIELSNPGFLDNEGQSITVDHGFTRISNRLTKIEQNLAWVYLNGAIGGGTGGGGTGTDIEYTITIAEGNTAYTATTSVDINITINSGSSKKAFTVIGRNVNTGIVIGTWKIYSLTRTKLTLTNLTGTTDIEFSAYDSANNYTTPAYIKIVAGAISLSVNNVDPTIYIGGVSEVLANYNITNNIANSPAGFLLTVNGIEVANVVGITSAFRTLSYNIRDIIFNSGLFVPTSKQKFKFVAYATTILNSTTLTSNIIEFSVSVADADKLVIITDDVSNFLPSNTPSQTYEDLTKVEQGSRLVFPYYLSYGKSIYNSFVLTYTVYKVTALGETLETSGTIPNILPNDINRSLSLNISWDPNLPGEYFRIDLFGYATSGPNDLTAQDSTFVTFTVSKSSTVVLSANNDIQTLLAYYSNISGFPNNTTGTWTYTLPTSGKFTYGGTFRPKFPNGVKLTLKDVNGVTSGFIPDTTVNDQIPGIVLQGESYGYLEVAEQMFPEVNINSGISFFQAGGFNLSFTYKALTSSDPDEVIVSIGKYQDDMLYSGIEITLEKIYVKIGSADTLICKLPQESLLTVDIDVSLLSGGWYFKIFINGVLSAVTRVLESDIDWQFGTDLYLGCRYDNGIRSRFSNVTFYDIKIYTSSQSEYAIVQNYISATEQALLIEGSIDQNLDTNLRLKNFFDSAGDCIIWDKTANNGKGDFLSGQPLYQTLVSRVDSTYPILLIEETSSSPTLFKAYSTAIFSASEKGTIMDTTFSAKFTYTSTEGTVVVTTPQNVSADKGVRIGLQGTSSLSYNAKNYELYIGDKNIAGDKLLFLPTDKWLPENEFTLKADVMDSSHVNNVVIGKIINGDVLNSENIPVKPLGATPPMALGNDIWGGNQELAESIRGKIKHTSDGFPTLVFIRYAPDADGNIPQPEFKGIYNFNLGRYAYYNLGLKILTNFQKVNLSGPSLVSDYTEAYIPAWNTGLDNGVYSIEINQNTSAQGAFQQDALPIVKFMGDVIYTSRDSETAYNKVKKFYTQMANMSLTKIPKYTMDDSGQTPRKLIDLGVNADQWNSLIIYGLDDHAYNSNFEVFKSLVPTNTYSIPENSTSTEFWQYIGTISSFYNLDKNAYYNFATSDTHLNWENACGYFIIGLVFGMVDSMCKNLTLRNWGTDVWSTAFYDMDTAFGLNNQGQDIVEYFAHLHRWQNINRSDTNLTSYEQIKNYQSDASYRQYFASWWNRIWEVLENLGVIDSGAIGNRVTIEEIYSNLRQNLFPNPDTFIEENYKGYTDKTGSIIFNFDYKIKYLKIAQTYNIQTQTYTDSTDFSQLKFLHGNRVIHVRDWFRKRIYFLDSIYGVKNNVVSIPTTIESPVNSLWAANKATGSSSGSKFVAKMSANSKILYRYSFDKTVGSFWLDETTKNVMVPIPNGETIVYIYANDYLTKFDYFKSYPWTGLNNINLPLLEDLDLSNLANMPASDFFQGGVYNPSSNIGLKNIKKLNLSNVILKGETAAAYTLDVSNCSKLQELDISNSSITKVTLPTSAVLKKYNLSGTAITSLVLKNQAFLETLLIDNCDNLTTIAIENCNKLTSISLPKNVQTVTITNCALLDTISLPYTSINNSISNLTRISIDNCPGLKTFSITGQNNPNLIVELVGAKNLEYLNLSYTSTLNITLPSIFANGQPNFSSLKSLNISNTNISELKYNDLALVGYLDLSYFPNLDNIQASECKQLTKVVCVNNENNPINLFPGSFRNCSLLNTLYGNFNIMGSEVFRGCTALRLNSDAIYNVQGTSQFLTGNDVCNLSIDSSASSLYALFEQCSNISYNDFKYIMPRLTSSITSIEAMFKECSSINGAIWYDLFRACPNVVYIKEAFSGCSLSGIFYSRSNDYLPTDSSTWGILDFIPHVLDAESAFERNALNWIDNKVFAPVVYNNVTTYSTLAKVDKMFRGCSVLTSCIDTRATILTRGSLNSETFFTNLRNLLALYPSEVFAGCMNIDMDIINDGDNTLLFHTITNSGNIAVVLTNTLYSGIRLIGDIKVNIFGGKSRTFTKGGQTYYIPKLTSIQYPFSTIVGSRADIRLSEMSEIFRNINTTLLQAIGVFRNLNIVPGTGTIPADIFKGCVALNSIESLFSGLNLNNNGNIYQFPPTYTDGGIQKRMFEDCISLKTTKNLFNGCTDLKIELVGEGFKNCQLTDVSGMFSNTSLFGTIPYKLFFMDKLVNGVPTISRTITTMDNIFSGCWLLGYTSDRSINIGEQLSENRYTTWSDHIVTNPGTKVSFKLNTTNLQKVYNYDRDETEYIPYIPAYYLETKYTYDGNTYTVYDTSGITFYTYNQTTYVINEYDGYSDMEVYTYDGNVYTLYVVPDLYVKNPQYNPGEYAFDQWYLDGYGWRVVTAAIPEEQSELDAQKTRIYGKYLAYDYQQENVITAQGHPYGGRYKECYQNYMIPTDLFRYCSKTANLSNVLKDLNWYANIIETNEETLEKTIVSTKTIEGLTGRIPTRLFESLTDNTILNSVFKDTKFDAFVGLEAYSSVNKRGIMFPPDLFKNNSALVEIPAMFNNIQVPVGVDINEDLFFNLPNLKNISQCFANCQFNTDWYTGAPGNYSQITFNTLFKFNLRLTNASSLFANYIEELGVYRGLYIIDSTLLNLSYSLANISGMFYNNINLQGAVPLFREVEYPVLTIFNNYLYGVDKTKITNESQVELRLRPDQWQV